jgi:hypothetical protein
MDQFTKLCDRVLAFRAGLCMPLQVTQFFVAEVPPGRQGS